MSRTALTAIAPRAKRKTMRAAVIAAPGRIEIRQVPVCEPGPTQVRIRMEGCGICASNLPVWEGRDWFEYPREPGSPGHEGWGVVDAVGSDVTEFTVGQRVACMSFRAYAEYDVAESDSVAALPAWLDGAAFPGEPLACAVNVFRRSDIRSGQRSHSGDRISGRAFDIIGSGRGRRGHRNLAATVCTGVGSEDGGGAYGDHGRPLSRN